MGFYASGNGNAIIKEGKREELKNLLHKADEDGKIDPDIEWDFAESYTRIDFWQSDSHWHEEDVYDFLNMLSPFVTEGSMYFNGEDNSNWRYVFNPETNEWDESDGKVIFDLSEISDEDLIKELKKRGLVLVCK